MMMNPIYGLLAVVATMLGLEPVNWLADYPLLSIIIIVSWQWTPFAILIFITSLQSQDTSRKKRHFLTVPGSGRGSGC